MPMEMYQDYLGSFDKVHVCRIPVGTHTPLTVKFVGKYIYVEKPPEVTEVQKH
jgi:hypothetical protein